MAFFTTTVTFSMVSNVSGGATLTLPFTNSATLAGIRLRTQWPVIDGASLVRGTDTYKRFEHEPRPRAELEPEMVALHKRFTERSAQILYRGTTIKTYNEPEAIRG